LCVDVRALHRGRVDGKGPKHTKTDPLKVAYSEQYLDAWLAGQPMTKAEATYLAPHPYANKILASSA
jgi:hypothetical protein